MMDVQYYFMKVVNSEHCDMRGFLSFIILWLLSKKEMYGQELAQEIAKRKGERPNPGTLYPALRNLEKKGLIRSQSSGRTRTYTITTLGRSDLDRAGEYFYRVFGDILEERRCTRDIVYEV